MSYLLSALNIFHAVLLAGGVVLITDAFRRLLRGERS
jgi:hypothetical protein